MPRQKILTRKILALAWPAIAVNVTTPLLSLVDVAVVGHIGNSVYIAAIALGATMFNTLYWLFGFLRMGTSGQTAQAYGAGDRTECVRMLARALIIAVLAGVLLMAVHTPLGNALLTFLDDRDVAQGTAMHYFSIAILGAPGVMITYALSGWFLGMQDSKPILWMALVANSLNIALNLFFVFVLKMSITGVAAATAVSQWVGACVGLALVWRQLRRIGLKNGFKGWRKGLLAWLAMRRFFTINIDIFLRTLCLVAVTLWFTHAGAKQGVLVLSANALLMQLFMLFSYFTDGFAFAGEALAGRYAGAHNTKRLRQVVVRLMRIGLVLSAICTVLYFLGGQEIMKVLTDQDDVLQVAYEYRWWVVAIPFAGFMSFIWDGIYIGLTQTRLMVLSMLIAMAVFYIIYFTCEPTLHNHALWLAFVVYLFARGVAQSLFYMKIEPR